MCQSCKRTLRLSAKAIAYVPKTDKYAYVTGLSAAATPFVPISGIRASASAPTTIVHYPKCTCDHPDFRSSSSYCERCSYDKKKKIKSLFLQKLLQEIEQITKINRNI